MPFGISLTGAAGATATNLIGPVTTAFNCGVTQPDGMVDLRLHFDHRVLDGMLAARALEEIEDVLKHDIVAELQLMACSETPPAGWNRVVRSQESGARGQESGVSKEHSW